MDVQQLIRCQISRSIHYTSTIIVQLPEEANSQAQSSIVTALMCPLNLPTKEKLAYYYTSPAPMHAVACRTGEACARWLAGQGETFD